MLLVSVSKLQKHFLCVVVMQAASKTKVKIMFSAFQSPTGSLKDPGTTLANSNTTNSSSRRNELLTNTGGGVAAVSAAGTVASIRAPLTAAAAAATAEMAAADTNAAFRAKPPTRRPGFRAWADFLAVADDGPESKVVATAATRASAGQLSHEALVAMFDRVDQDMQVWSQLLLATVYESEEEEEEEWEDGGGGGDGLRGRQQQQRWQRGGGGVTTGGKLAPVEEEEDVEDHTFLTGGFWAGRGLNQWEVHSGWMIQSRFRLWCYGLALAFTRCFSTPGKKLRLMYFGTGP